MRTSNIRNLQVGDKIIRTFKNGTVIEQTVLRINDKSFWVGSYPKSYGTLEFMFKCPGDIVKCEIIKK